jgi:hypothetical protein
MNYIFFFFSIFAIIWELVAIKEPRKVAKFSKQLRLDTKSKKFDELTSTQRAFSVLLLLYSLWAITGLFTSQWIIFSVLIIISFIPKKVIWYRVFDSFISLILLVSAILNEFHFHINLWNELLKLLK